MSTLHLRARVDAPVDEVRRALTDADALRAWLAEHAEVDLPHTYAFWGRYTPEGDAPHQRPLHVDDWTLRFAWLLDGAETTVEIVLEDGGPASTVVALTQTHVPSWSEAVAEDSVRGVLATFWALAVENLVDYLTRREPTPKCDFTSRRLRAEVVVAAAPEDLYDSLMAPERIRRWFGANVDIEPHVGGRWAMGGFDLVESPARIVELEPGRRVRIDWGGFVSTWELEGSVGATRLTFIHSGFDEDRPPYAGWTGWLAGVAELRRFHEVAGWHPIWLAYETPGVPEGMLAR